MEISDGNIFIKVLPTVDDVFLEGKAMHHCIFTNGYYKREDSLLLTAKIHEKRIETIEVDLRSYELVQSRGACNQNSKYHDVIVNLINQNMDTIRSFSKKG